MKIKKALKDSWIWCRESARFLYWSIRTHPPPIPKFVSDILADRRLPSFFFGMCAEAAGLTIQSEAGFRIYPILDAIVGFILVVVIIKIQGKVK